MANRIPRHRRPLIYLLVAGVAGCYAWAVVVTTFWHPGAIGLDYDAPGTDYMVFHTAVSLVLQGDLSTLYDPDRFTALLNRIFHGYLSEDLAFRPWIYPPPFLLLLLPFGLLGFGLSYGLFQLATALAMLGALRLVAGRRALFVGVAALLCSAASISVVSGQSSFLIVALLTAGAGLLDRRPVLAGIVFGLLGFKPQFVLMIPFLLLAGQAWRAAAAAAAASAAMAASCLLWLGPGVWTGWFAVFAHSIGDADGRWFLLGRLWGESVYTCVYLLGAPRGLAEVAQLGAILLAGGAVWRAFRRPMAACLRVAVLLAASLLAAPHSGPYDLVLLVASWGLLLSHLGPRADSRDWFLGLLVWLAPLLGLPVLSLAGRFCPVLTLALLGSIFRHAGTPRRIEAPA
jgi:alpha-1,2-mannosyltransferase